MSHPIATDFQATARRRLAASGARPALAGLIAAVLLQTLALTAAPVRAQSSDGPDARETIDHVERAFGYQIGDLVTRQIIVRGAALAAARQALPQPRQINPWLTLRDVGLQSQSDDERIVLTYQITGAASEVNLLELPVIELKSDEGTVARIDAMPISVSPLIGKHAFQRTGLGQLQADRPPPQADVGRMQRRLNGLIAAFFLLAGALLWRRWLRNRPDRRPPFAQARYVLRHNADADRAWRELHRAFDQTAGQSVFLEDLDDFIERHPAFKPASASIRSFFERSREHFFAGSGMEPGDQIADLKALAIRLARLESRQ